MPIPGPMVGVRTILRSVNLNVGRLLNTGEGALEFLVPDANQPDNFRIVKTLETGFDRKSLDELERGDGKTVRFDVADLDGTLGAVIREKELFLRHQGEYFKVTDVPKLAPNETQVFEITCVERTLKNSFFGK